MRSRPFDDEFVCPHCGEELPGDAQFCPACGSDADTGWSDMAEYAGLDLPDEEEEQYELDAAAAPVSRWQQIVMATAVVLLVAMLLAILGSLR